MARILLQMYVLFNSRETETLIISRSIVRFYQMAVILKYVRSKFFVLMREQMMHALLLCKNFSCYLCFLRSPHFPISYILFDMKLWLVLKYISKGSKHVVLLASLRKVIDHKCTSWREILVIEPFASKSSKSWYFLLQALTFLLQALTLIESSVTFRIHCCAFH